MPKRLDYIASGRFLHDDLFHRTLRVVRKIPDLWKRDGCIEPTLLTWAGERIPTEDGGTVEDLCVLPLGGIPEKDWPKQIVAMVQLTQACGLVFIQQRPLEVQVFFETPLGSRVWSLPLRRHGDILLMEDAVMTAEDRASLGILWKPESLN